MKRKILLIVMLAAFGAVGIAQVDRTAVIMNGQTMLSRPMSFTDNDTITTSDTTNITIHNPQAYMQHQVFTYTLDSVSGDPSITVIAYGKVSSDGSWTQIGSTQTWDDVSDNPQTISSTAPINYNYLKVEFAANGTTQKSKILTFDVRTANAMEVPSNAGTVTFSRATSGTVTLTSADDDANAALTVAAGGTGALTIGDATSTTAITSSDWAIGATGAMTGIGAITADGLITANAGVTLGAGDDLIGSSTSDITINTDKFTVAGATGNTVVAGSFDVDGIVTTDSTVSIGGWGYTGEHVILPEASSNTNAGLGNYSMVDYSATAGKVFAGTYSRMLAMTTNQTNQSTMVGTESQFRLRDVNIANGVHAGLWAYAEQSGTSVLSGNGTFDAISATVESASTFTVGATEHVTGITVDASIDAGASIDGSANYSAVYIKSNGLDWFYGINIEGVDDDICLQNDETITNSTDGTVAVSGVLSANLRAATVVVNTDESETLTAAQSGAFVTFDGAGTATIPDPSSATIGVVYYLLQTTDNNLTVTCTTADNNAIICNGVATSDNVTISTSDHKIGAGMVVKGISATKWYVGGLNPESILTPEAAD